jgi:hypothetical protein
MNRAVARFREWRSPEGARRNWSNGHGVPCPYDAAQKITLGEDGAPVGTSIAKQYGPDEETALDLDRPLGHVATPT